MRSGDSSAGKLPCREQCDRVSVRELGDTVRMPAQTDVEAVIAALPRNVALGDEYRYSCLPLCVLDSIYSIDSRYESVQALIGRYCDHYGVRRYRPTIGRLPAPARQLHVDVLIGQIERLLPSDLPGRSYGACGHHRHRRTGSCVPRPCFVSVTCSTEVT